MRDKKIVRMSLLVSLILTLSAMTASAQQKNRLKVMTWNITGGACKYAKPNTDMRHYADQIRAKNPDVIAIQEITFEQAYWLAYYLDRAKPYNVRFLWTKRCLTKYLPGHSLSDYGNAILSPHLIKPEGGYFDGGFYVSPDPDRQNSDYPEFIGVAQASVQLPKTDGKPGGPWVRVYGAHLTGNNGDPKKGGARNAGKQVEDTMIHIDRADAKAWGQPRTILMGDFNAFPSVHPCQAFTSKGKDYNSYAWLTYHYRADFQFKDAWLVKESGVPGDVCGFTLSSPSNPDPVWRYDYIFFRNTGGFTVKKMEVVKPQPLKLPRLSGHFPVYAELEF